MSRPASSTRGSWETPGGTCPECSFDWDVSSYEALVGQCVRNVAVFGAVLSRVDPAAAVDPGLWSASRYVWHTVDVLRFGTERLWTVSVDPSFGFPEWDENVIAEVRGTTPCRHSSVSSPSSRRPRLGELLRSKHRTTSPRRTPRQAPFARSTSCSATRTRSATTSGTFSGPFRPNPAPDHRLDSFCDDGPDGSRGFDWPG